MEYYNLCEQDSLLSQYMSELRDKNIQTDRMRFRTNVRRIGQIMAYEVSKKLAFDNTDVETPLAVAHTRTIGSNVVLGTVLRAGLPLHEGFLSYFDCAENAFVSAYRKYRNDSDDFDIQIEYMATPRLEGKTLILVDPMLATGASMVMAYKALLAKGEPARVHIVSIIASQQAVDFVKTHFDEEKTTLWVADVDPVLNDHSYIVPGLGDCGDLLYGIKE
ncbi:MAG: uracil phosphoribosyltransferase [Muribaculaceae bacterium]|nr:uracil phosphoribosyltransferase [Muribaculaceae bacterium]